MLQSTIPGLWEDVDIDFFRTGIELPLPDEIVHGIRFDPMDRKLMDEPHPLKGRMNSAGCYLYYCYYDFWNGTKPMYIYAGKSGNLAKRLWTHWRYGEYINEFFTTYIDTGRLAIEVPRKDGGTEWLNPEPIVRAALWFEKDEVERTMLEHGLIYAYRPIMNRG